MFRIATKGKHLPRTLVAAASKNNTSAVARSFVHATRILLEKRTVNLPTMGDAITEGTVVEWSAVVGQAVKVDDVVAMVETDKVTVEIKADGEGVVTQQFCNVDDTIEVGKPLYELDTEAEATVEAGTASTSAAPESSKEEAAVATPKVPVAASESKTAAPAPSRTPMIKFLGKEGWAQKLNGHATPEIYYDLPPMYGRPAFTEEEMEALIMGGANVAPDVLAYSHGAAFK